MAYEGSDYREKLKQRARGAREYGQSLDLRHPVQSGAAIRTNPLFQDQSDESIIGFSTIATMKT